MHAEGPDYSLTQAGLLPAFSNITLEPAGHLRQELVNANAKGGTSAVRFGEMPDGYGMNVLAPIFELLAPGVIDEATFCEMIAADIAPASNYSTNYEGEPRMAVPLFQILARWERQLS